MRLLVVGGSGFLGGYVIREAARQGHQVLALARSPAAARTVEGNGARPLAGDLDDARRLDEAFSDAHCEALVCLASLGRGHGPDIVAAAEEAGIPRAVFVSTTAVTTTLHPPTKQVRLMAEQQIRRSGLDWTIVRPTMIYGAPGDRNLSRLLRLLSRAAVLPVPRTSKCLHQPVHVADAATAVLTTLQCPAAIGARYDVAGPEPLPFTELLHTCARTVGSRTRLVPVPLAPLITLARGYELLSRHPRIRAEQLLRLGEDKAFAIDDAVRDLGYAPRPFDEGIADEARMLGLAA
ncbi:MAG: SDR family oxidoreductase [Streptosporangiaceae bacterium]